MDQLNQQVARARRRLVVEQFFNRLIWCLLIAFAVATVAIAAPRVFVIPGLPIEWDFGWLVGSASLAFIVAVVWTMATRRSRLDAAIEIDQRFDLRERVASSLSLSEADLQSPAGQAVVSDAARAIQRIDVNEKFRPRLDRRAWWPLVPACLAIGITFFFSNREASSTTEVTDSAAIAKQVQQSAEALRKKIAERRKALEEKGLKDAEGIFKEIEKGTKDLAEKKKVDRTKAVVKLNDLGKQLEKRRQELGGKEGMQRQFNKLKNLDQGPAGKFANAMKRGDMKQAVQELEKLRKELANGKMSKEKKTQLQKQLGQMQEKLAASVEAFDKAKENLEKQIEKERRQGNLSKASELQKKLDQLAQKQPQMGQMKQMAEQMAQAQEALEKGDAKQAAEAMDQMAEQMAQMQQEMDEMEMLDAAMDELQMAKNAMGCQECNGQGCQACQGQGMPGMGDMGGNPSGKPGMGMGRGNGKGPRPDEEDATKLRDSRVRQKPGRGAVTFGGFADGGNKKGNVLESIKEEMSGAVSQPAEAVTNERLPRAHREHAEEYFRALRTGE